MIRALKYFFDRWYFPLGVYGTACFIALCIEMLILDHVLPHTSSLSYISLYNMGLCGLGLFGSGLYQFIRKRWGKGLLSWGLLIALSLYFAILVIVFNHLAV